MTVNGYGLSFWDDEKVLKLTMVIDGLQIL